MTVESTPLSTEEIEILRPLPAYTPDATLLRRASHINALCDMAARTAAAEERARGAEGEVEEIKRYLDQSEIAMPGGTVDYTLPDRVLAACIAATDEDDRSRLAAMATALEAKDRALEPFARIGEHLDDGWHDEDEFGLFCPDDVLFERIKLKAFRAARQALSPEAQQETGAIRNLGAPHG